MASGWERMGSKLLLTSCWRNLGLKLQGPSLRPWAIAIPQVGIGDSLTLQDHMDLQERGSHSKDADAHLGGFRNPMPTVQVPKN